VSVQVISTVSISQISEKKKERDVFIRLLAPETKAKHTSHLRKGKDNANFNPVTVPKGGKFRDLRDVWEERRQQGRGQTRPLEIARGEGVGSPTVNWFTRSL